MSRRVSLFLMGLVCWIASATAVAQTAINGHITGFEVCVQSVDECGGYASFVGTFVGKINGNDTTAAWAARVKHADLDQTKPQAVTKVLEGDWILILDFNTAIAGTVAGGTLTFRPNNTFAVELILPIAQGGTAYFDGTLNHNTIPPPVQGRFFTK